MTYLNVPCIFGGVIHNWVKFILFITILGLIKIRDIEIWSGKQDNDIIGDEE